MERLEIDRGLIKALAAEIGRDRRTVSLALRGAVRTPLARQVRALAVAKYNARVVVEKEPDSNDGIDGMGIES